MQRPNIKGLCQGMFKFNPTEYQLDFMYDCMNYKRIIGVFARQAGKSESIAKVAVMHAQKARGVRVLIFAPTDRQTGLLAEKIRLTIGQMIKPSLFSIKSQTLRQFYFSNGSYIVCETTGDTGETIRGYTGDVIILEEAGSIKDSIVHSVILPMGGTTDAAIIKIGTPHGRNQFYESSISKDYKIHLIDWKRAVKAGILSKTYVDDMRANLPSDKFKTEMEAQFIADEDAYFGYDLIESCIALIPEENKKQGNNQYYLGADIARLGKDSTCLMILKKGNPNTIVKIIDIPKCTLDFVIDKIIELYGKYKFNKIFIDETGLGAGVRDVLAKQYNLLNPRANISETRTFKMSDIVVGIKFTIQSKIDIYSNLKVLMEQGKLKFPNHPKLIAQLRDFRYETTVSGNVKLHHSEYEHDDYCFVAGTKVLTNKGQKNIEDIKIGDLVMTRCGHNVVKATGSRKAEVITRFGLTGTPEHPFITTKGLVKFINVNASLLIYKWNEKQKSIMVGNITDTPTQNGGTYEYIIGRTEVVRFLVRFTDNCGQIILDQYRKVLSSITKTGILLTTLFQIWGFYPGLSISAGTCLPKKVSKDLGPFLRNTGDQQQKNGTVRRLGVNGTGSKPKHLSQIYQNILTHATNVGKLIFRRESRKPDFVQRNAGTQIQTGDGKKKEVVYNLSITNCNEYFVNNILVHNCDSLALSAYGLKYQNEMIFDFVEA